MERIFFVYREILGGMNGRNEVLSVPEKVGKRSYYLSTLPVVLSSAAVVGKKEGEGPLKDRFDRISDDSYFGEETWEKAESHMLRECFQLSCDKAGLSPTARRFSPTLVFFNVIAAMIAIAIAAYAKNP